jgi:hypothetical protein
MKALILAALVAAGVLSASVAAEAVEMYTLPVTVDDNEFVSCHIANVSAQTRSFTFEIIDTTGTIRASGQNTLLAGQIGGGGIGVGTSGGLFYCHFSAAGQKTNWRAAIKRSATAFGGDLIVSPAE